MKKLFIAVILSAIYMGIGTIYSMDVEKDFQPDSTETSQLSFDGLLNTHTLIDIFNNPLIFMRRPKTDNKEIVNGINNNLSKGLQICLALESEDRKTSVNILDLAKKAGWYYQSTDKKYNVDYLHLTAYSTPNSLTSRCCRFSLVKTSQGYVPCQMKFSREITPKFDLIFHGLMTVGIIGLSLYALKYKYLNN